MKKLSYERKKAMYGRAFISVWVIGVLLFFAIPFVKTLIYSFNDVSFSGGNGLSLEFLGIESYKRMFTADNEMLPKLTDMLLSLLYNVPVTVMFSLFIAVVLNAPFRGRAIFRSIFFMPVIVMSGTIMLLFKSDEVAMLLFNTTDAGNNFFENITILNELFTNFGWGEEFIGIIQNIVSGVINVCWSCGVQYILCLAALQGIPDSLYEVARVEGATKWEEFWKLTFPMCRPVLFVCIIYTVITNASEGQFTNYIQSVSFTDFDYGYASALAMLYCLTVLLILGFIAFLLKSWWTTDIKK